MPIKKRSEDWEQWNVSPELKKRLRDMARQRRKDPTPSEKILYEALRDRRLDRHKFRREYYLGPFILDFYCPQERLAVEIDGPIHDLQQEADQLRQELIKALGIRFVRVTSEEVEQNIEEVLQTLREALNPSSGSSTLSPGRRPRGMRGATEGRRG
jgi:very-short-patch-repair endonuclease